MGLDDPPSAGADTAMARLFSVQLPAEQQVLALFGAKWALGALRALVELKVPDELAPAPRTAADLSVRTGTDQDVLYRLLRAVSAVGILEERPDATFALTPVSQGLVSGAENGIRDMFLFACDPMLWRPYENVAHIARTGRPAFDAAFGMSFYEYTKANPASGALLDRAMRQNHYPGTDRILAEFDFGRFPSIADVGGGRGQFLAEVLLRHPGCTGVLVDQPHTIAAARETFDADGLRERVAFAPTDFFVQVPAGCAAYLVKHTLHNWDDARATLILRRIRAAIGTDPGARLLIVDQLLTGPGEWDIGKLIDVEAAAVLGGRERSRAEWDRIAGPAGFALVNDPVPGDLALLEYRPVSRPAAGDGGPASPGT